MSFADLMRQCGNLLAEAKALHEDATEAARVLKVLGNKRGAANLERIAQRAQPVADKRINELLASL